MAMLDEDRNGYGTKQEFAQFMVKMHQMDGRTDRLPTGNDAKQPRSEAGRKKKRRRRAAPKDPTSDHDEV